MRFRISHRTTFAYRTPAKSIIQILRLTPRSHDGQRIGTWRIDMDVDHAFRMGQDPFGNITHTASIAGPLNKLTISVDGDVETFDTTGVVRDSSERFPPELYLRSSPLTEAGTELRAFADATIQKEASPLGRLHTLMAAVADKIAFDESAAAPAADADAAFKAGKGDYHDIAHVFIAAARHIGAPARYVSGYYVDEDDAGKAVAHDWAEAYAPEIGWIGFDSARQICPVQRHVSVARGLDRMGAAPIRASRSGGEGEDISVEIRVSQQQDQRQS